MDDRAGLGRAGERRAEKELRRKRFRVVTRNYRCPLGEIDLVALDDATVVFVEVKTRTGNDLADPQDAVTREKQRRLYRAAEFFLKQTRSQDRPCRFDVVAITLNDAGGMDVEHLVDAFVPQR